MISRNSHDIIECCLYPHGIQQGLDYTDNPNQCVLLFKVTLIPKIINSLLICIITNHTNTIHLLTCSSMWLSTLLDITTTPQPGKLKQLHNFIVGKCWSMHDFIIVIIPLGHKSKHIIKIFAIHPFPFLSQILRSYFRDVWTCTMLLDVTWYTMSSLKMID